MYGFQLGREFKLSIAEILSLFPTGEVTFSASGVIILDGISEEEVLKKAKRIGGTIKIFECSFIASKEAILEKIYAQGELCEGKFKYALNLFGEKSLSLVNMLKDSKRGMKKREISARYFNKDDNKNLSSAQILGNSILKKGYDYNIVDVGGMFYFGKTLWVQDIDAYSARDYDKSRDMQVGMLPPKLAQMMVNLGGGTKIYDPFVGLGTVLIESLYMGNTEVYGSDLSEKMVETSEQNLRALKKGGSKISIKKLNAKFIEESEFLSIADSIVTEGYLGEVMTQRNISHERIQKQRESLVRIYESFFSGLQKADFQGNIVISFPFWEMRGKYFYFEEIYAIINEYCSVQKLLPEEFSFGVTRQGSLLYKRGKQLVGREVFKLKIK